MSPLVVQRNGKGVIPIASPNWGYYSISFVAEPLELFGDVGIWWLVSFKGEGGDVYMAIRVAFAVV